MLRQRYLMVLALLLSSCLSHASVTLSNTRVVYNANSKESNINVTNNGITPFLVQSWIENIDSQDSQSPFIVTPPLFRLDSGKSNALRIIYKGSILPQDRESLFWLNVKSIPSSAKSDKNKLQIAVNTRIKLFYRPVNLADDISDISKSVDWSVAGDKLIVHNNSSYYVSFSEVNINKKNITEIKMVAPKSSKEFSLKGIEVKRKEPVYWKYINDYGGSSPLIKQEIE